MGRFNRSEHKATKVKELIAVVALYFLVTALTIMTIFVVGNGIVNAGIAKENLRKNGTVKTTSSLIENDAEFVANNARYSSITIEQSTWTILNQENIHVKLPMASTTKIITAILACRSNMDDIVTVAAEAEGVEGSSIYLRKGEQVSLRDLVYGLMLRSGNDSAIAIAIHLGGSVQGFAQMMNDYAIECEAKNTNFVNPHGLHNDNHYTTAYDLAVMTAKALNNAEFCKIVSTKMHVIKSNTQPDRYIANKNKMLNMFDGAIGVKTGYTKIAGRCLVSAAERNDIKLVSVVLNIPDMWDRSCHNLSDGYKHCKQVNLVEPNEELMRIRLPKSTNTVGICVKNTLKYMVFDNNTDITHEITFDKNLPKKLENGQKIGVIKLFDCKRLIFTENIYTMNI